VLRGEREHLLERPRRGWQDLGRGWLARVHLRRQPAQRDGRPQHVPREVEQARHLVARHRDLTGSIGAGQVHLEHDPADALQVAEAARDLLGDRVERLVVRRNLHQQLERVARARHGRPGLLPEHDGALVAGHRRIDVLQRAGQRALDRGQVQLGGLNASKPDERLVEARADVDEAGARHALRGGHQRHGA